MGDEWVCGDEIYQEKVTLEDNIPQEIVIVYEKCIQCQEIGVEIEGIVVMEIMQGSKWEKKDADDYEYLASYQKDPSDSNSRVHFILSEDLLLL